MSPSETSSSQPSPRLLEALARCNRTELYQLCKQAGYTPATGATRDELIDQLSGRIDLPTKTTEIDRWRQGLKGFVEQHWSILQPQLTCPIRKDINACNGCLDTQVVACVVEQRECESLIQLHRK